MSAVLVKNVLNSGLPSWLKPVAVAFATFADPDGTKIYPSVNQVAGMVGRSERQTFRAVKALRKLGILEPVGRASQFAPVEYRLNAASLPKNGFPQDFHRVFHRRHIKNTGVSEISTIHPQVSTDTHDRTPLTPVSYNQPYNQPVRTSTSTTRARGRKAVV